MMNGTAYGIGRIGPTDWFSNHRLNLFQRYVSDSVQHVRLQRWSSTLKSHYMETY